MTDLMDDADREVFRKGFLNDDFQRHPMANDIIKIAAENEIDLTNVSAVSMVLENLKGAEGTDPKIILILSLILECLVHHKEMLTLKELMDEQEIDNDNKE
ncbi:hypothetical protein [Sulfitobacter sp. R18_1]|uniref:hypothetical protein n=1 Tax=Sulfitobacter sp. R18_1 TaxID=2821104 RepID=UPI001ADC9CF4|nr:hypothetical protein [Sulfitobacter sp. R18_1]MBO9428626.1 hypothetical protein [Sulfitobacter sp. R18_1]